MLDPLSSHYSYAQRIKGNASRNQSWAGDPIKVAKTIGKVLSTSHPGQRYQVGIDVHLGALAARIIPDGILEYLVKRVVAC